MSKRIPLLVFGLLGSALCAFGQAGRHIPKAPTPLPTPVVEVPTTAPTAKPERLKIRVFTDLPIDAVRDFKRANNLSTWFVERLRDSRMLEVLDGGRANQHEAVLYAKREENTLTVFVGLEYDQFADRMGSSRPKADEASLNVIVLAPKTGADRESRRVPLSDRNILDPQKGVMNKVCHPEVRGNDLLLLKATLSAAELVMRYFNLTVPPECG